MSASTGLTLHGFITVLALLFYIVASRAFDQRRHPTAAIAWVLFILLVPYLALPSFLLFGSRKQRRPLFRPTLRAPASDAMPWVVPTVVALGQPWPSSYAGLRIHADGDEALAALHEILDGATASIDLCTFIIGRDAVGRGVVDRLCAKARAGVKVRVMVDGMGRLMRSHPDLAPLVDAGAELAVFAPPLRAPLRARSNLRDHRKMVIADADLPSRRLWTGGRNLACEYFSPYRGSPAWVDLTFDLGGEFVRQAAALFEDDWTYARRTHVERSARAQPRQPVLPPPPHAQLVASGPDEADDTIYTLLVTGAHRAEERVLLVTPYFVPDAALQLALAMAARRGVDVDLIVPAKSNHPMSDFARRRALRNIARAGCRVWLHPGMLHAKLAVFDGALALAGSANIDSRSLFLNYELMVAFNESLHVGRFADWAAGLRQRSAPFTPKPPGLFTDLAEGLVLGAGFQL